MVFFLIVLGCVTLSNRPISPSTRDSIPNGRLPSDVEPTHYALSLQIDPSQGQFSGIANVSIQIRKKLDHFWMHGKGLHVKNVTLTLQNERLIPVRYVQKNDDGVVLIELPREITPQTALLTITYQAPLKNELNGLYRVKEGQHAYAFTQFEPVAARQCFPSFDEPRFKTPFSISLTVPKNEIAISNTLEESTQIDGVWKTVRFKITKPLPTYLVAFAIGPFDVVAAKPIGKFMSRSPLPFRAISTKGKGRQLRYALDNTPRIVSLLEEYFQIPYPYEKLDIIAVPDFAAGAMENAGAITFREQLLLFNEKHLTPSQKKGFANVMAHELAHQWFGNLVTMPWWNDLWLNEAFATWMAYRTTQKFNPSYKENLNLIAHAHHAMAEDSLVSARQIRQSIQSNHDIHSAFDSITYSKGAAVLSMFEKYLGEATFKKAIQYHLKKFLYSTATTEDFLNSIAVVSNNDSIVSSFSSFLMQPGVPLVDIELNCKQSPYLTLKQSRYLPLGSTGSSSQTWKIPTCLKFGASKKSKEVCMLMSGEKTVLPLDFCPTWIVPNQDGASYFRFLLPSDILLSSLKSNHANEAERLAFSDSISSSIGNGKITLHDSWGLWPNLVKTKDFRLATMPIHWLTFSKENIYNDHEFEIMKNYSLQLLSPLVVNNPSSDDDIEINSKIVRFFIDVIDDENFKNTIYSSGNKYLSSILSHRPDPSLAPRELEDVALAVAVEKLSKESTKNIDEIIRSLQFINNAFTRADILFALSSLKGKSHVEKVRNVVFNSSLRKNEIMPYLFRLSSKTQDHEEFWEWFKSHYNQIKESITFNAAGGLPSVASSFCSRILADSVNDFFEDSIQLAPGGPRNLKETIEGIQLCDALKSAYGS